MLQKAIDLLRNAKRPLALAGAGLSAESGIPTFRGADGYWRNIKPEDIATASAFQRDPKFVFEWYAYRRDQVRQQCKPNPGHLALVELEKLRPEFWLLTQNVDGLSRQAGSAKVIELHGSLWILRCFSCSYSRQDLIVPTPLEHNCPQCKTGLLRPGVVWFGEALDPWAVQKSQELAAACDLMLVVGTSAKVYPAAGLVPQAISAGAKVIEINPENTPMSDLATVTLRKPVGEVLPLLVAGMA
jgi:NAD-dependent deacetylase